MGKLFDCNPTPLRVVRKRETNRACRERHREAIRERNRAWYARNREDRIKYFRENSAAFNSRTRKQREERRRKVILKYGGRCNCCGESYWRFLQVDHVNGDGAKQRKRRGGLYGYKLLCKLDDGPLDPNYQILCACCNQAKGNGENCPCPYGKDKPRRS